MMRKLFFGGELFEKTKKCRIYFFQLSTGKVEISFKFSVARRKIPANKKSAWSFQHIRKHFLFQALQICFSSREHRNSFNCTQIVQLLDQFNFSRYKLRVLQILRYRIIDRENDFFILSAFQRGLDKKRASFRWLFLF